MAVAAKMETNLSSHSFCANRAYVFLHMRYHLTARTNHSILSSHSCHKIQNSKGPF